MARLRLRDGVEISWHAWGDGPLVVLGCYWSMHPSALEPIIAELRPDHRVVRYDDRGSGESTRSGPYDIETAAADLEAVVEAAGEGAVVVTTGDGGNRAVRVARRRPDLVRAVVSLTTAPVGLADFKESEGMIGSDTVVRAFLEMATVDYRGAIRSLLTATNPQMSEDELRERVRMQVEYSPAEAAVGRLRAWAEDEGALEAGRAIGERLWCLWAEGMASGWLPEGETYARLISELLPEAHVREVADGMVSRPDETAAIVRAIHAAAVSRAAPGA